MSKPNHAATLAAYALSLAQGNVLADFEIDNLIEHCAAVCVRAGHLRSKMFETALRRAVIEELLDRIAELEVENALLSFAAKPWWKRLWA